MWIIFSWINRKQRRVRLSNVSKNCNNRRSIDQFTQTIEETTLQRDRDRDTSCLPALRTSKLNALRLVQLTHFSFWHFKLRSSFLRCLYMVNFILINFQFEFCVCVHDLNKSLKFILDNAKVEKVQLNLLQLVSIYFHCKFSFELKCHNSLYPFHNPLIPDS